jgi:hypothetical protein
MRGSLAASLAALLAASGALAAPVKVQHTEGLVHGFLVLSTLGGKPLADGDLLQEAKGDEVTSRLVFRFRDGSLHDETAVYSQRGRFRLLRSSLVQKGPAFKNPMTATINGKSGKVKVTYTEEDGDVEVEEKKLELEPDLANGLLLTLLKNISPKAAKTRVSMVAWTPKPMLVGLDIEPEGEDSFKLGGETRKATRYVVKVDIHGLMGVMADLLGKDPPDSRVWVMGGDTPAFIKSESPFYAGGPLWRIELVSPVFGEGAP